MPGTNETKTPDLIDQIKWLENIDHREQIRAALRTVFNKADDDIKLQVCRDLMIDQIYKTIDKFPLQTQKEMLAIITDKYLSQWAT